METLLIVILAVLVAGFAVLFLLLRGKTGKESGLDEFRREVRESLRDMHEVTHKTREEQFTKSTKIIKDVTEGLTKLREDNQRVLSLADQLRQLQDILKNPKQRGALGEHQLEVTLSNIFSPEDYKIQYQFKNGDIVDAVIFYQEKVIPIDSKFSLENYNRILETEDEAERKQYVDTLKYDLKKRIEETSKYIRPTEDTTDFALMFIPSEALYYDLITSKVGAIVDRSLLEYAFEKRVIPVSPTSFYAYLQTVVQGLRQIEFNKSTEKIIKGVQVLDRHLKVFHEHLQRLGKQIDTTRNTYEKADKEFEKIDKDILKIGKEESRLTLGDSETEN